MFLRYIDNTHAKFMPFMDFVFKKNHNRPKPNKPHISPPNQNKPKMLHTKPKPNNQPQSNHNRPKGSKHNHIKGRIWDIFIPHSKAHETVKELS